MTPGGSPGAAPQFAGGEDECYCDGVGIYDGGSAGGGVIHALPASSPQQASGRALPASLRSPVAGSQGVLCITAQQAGFMHSERW
jgi:hypothetical protein